MSYSNVNNNSYFYLNVYFPRNPCPAATFVVLYRKMCPRTDELRHRLEERDDYFKQNFIHCFCHCLRVSLRCRSDAGLGAIGGIADSYWGKIRGRSVEGTLEKLTAVAAVLFLALAFALNLIK